MALILNNFIGFETGGLEELVSVSGSPTVSSLVVRTGRYSCAIEGAGERVEINAFEESSDAGDDYILGFAFNSADASPDNFQNIFRAKDTLGTTIWVLKISTTGLRLSDNLGTNFDGSTPLSDDTWHYIEIRWQDLASGEFDLFLDGSSEISVTGADLTTGTALDRYWLEDSAGTINYYDDFYCYSGATGTSDFLGPGVEVLGAFQNTVEDATDQGSTLDQGTWTLVGHTPLVDEGFGDSAAYTSNSAETGFTICDEGDRDGPDGLITGTSKGAKWTHRLARGSGSGTIHKSRAGKNTTVEDTTVTLSTAFASKVTIKESTTHMPNVNTDSFAQGFLKETGGRNIFCAEMWAFLLHVQPALPATLEDAGMPTLNVYAGPFGT